MKRIVIGLLAASWAPALMAGNWKVPTTAKRLANPVAATPPNAARGERVYAENCVQCHGRSGAGDGKAQRVEYDLREVLASLSDGEIYWKITHGVGQMPSHAGVLTDEERWLSVNHLRALIKARGTDRAGTDRAGPASAGSR